MTRRFPTPLSAGPMHDGHMHIRDWPEDERPREKLLARGAPALSDAELLAIFIGCGPRGQSAVDLGRQLLSECGGLRGLLDRPSGELAKLRGLGPARACALVAALELGTRHLGQQLQRGEALADPDQAGAYFARKLRPLPHEVFACLFLDTRHRVLAYEELFRGTLDGSEVHPREVARRCLAHNAAAVIFGHNHPSGNPEASAADRAVTARLKQALALVEVRVLDHFIVGDGDPTSMARRGWL
jgi:DNA repair protein RadC